MGGQNHKNVAEFKNFKKSGNVVGGKAAFISGKNPDDADKTVCLQGHLFLLHLSERGVAK